MLKVLISIDLKALLNYRSNDEGVDSSSRHVCVAFHTGNTRPRLPNYFFQVKVFLRVKCHCHVYTKCRARVDFASIVWFWGPDAKESGCENELMQTLKKIKISRQWKCSPVTILLNWWGFEITLTSLTVLLFVARKFVEVTWAWEWVTVQMTKTIQQSRYEMKSLHI